MRGLGAAAKEHLRAEGIPFTVWTRHWFGADATTWHGDACGCLDDRCAGHHHDAQDDCGCLPALVDWFRADGGAGREAVAS